jgi:hypothetical protein
MFGNSDAEGTTTKTGSAHHVGVPVNDSLAKGHLIEDIGDKAAALVPGQSSFPYRLDDKDFCQMTLRARIGFTLCEDSVVCM